ncbi:ribonuclease III domain-containing protein [Dichotomocladium elegans]|nr:ribonuclease III domain-containing protein [Dichotomocladium elegans]
MEQQQQQLSSSMSDAALSAFGARLGLQALNPVLLEEAITHASAQQNKLTFLGKRVAGLYVSEYFHSKYPNMHLKGFNNILQSYIGLKSVSRIGTEVGLQDVMRWDRQSDDTNQMSAMADCFYAILGAVYQEQGPQAAKKFVHAYVLSRDLDVRPLIKLPEPKRHLSSLLRITGQEPAISRLLSETGRLSSSPVFVVGVFSGEKKLGEGFGSSLKMAEYRACQDALAAHYGLETKDFTVPSDADNADNYQPPPLGRTEAIV